jgi:hypothetical protein
MSSAKYSTIASFVVDEDPVFSYTGWNLAHSLVLRGDLRWADIHVQLTPEVEKSTIQMFEGLGCVTHRLTPFGDGKYCNKLAQWENLREIPADHIVLLDTDMICVSSFKDFLDANCIGGKVVDLANPKLEVLGSLFDDLRFPDRPAIVQVDANEDFTYRANCNGGFYSIPKRFGEELFQSWRLHAELLLADVSPLRRVGKEAHVDQIAFCMAIHKTGLPFDHLPSNVNYYGHFPGDHRWRDDRRALSVLHFHNSSLNVVGLLEPAGAMLDDERSVVAAANELIRQCFNTRLFWQMRYHRFAERGSGLGSRGSNLEYKRELLKKEGIEEAGSVLDVGCGDLEVLKSFNVRDYVGIDPSEVSLATAAAARSDWTFLRAPATTAPSADMVLCLEVAIHQETRENYTDLVNFLADKTERTLLVSGYDEMTEEISMNHMVFFYEPLRKSLEVTGKFKTIRKIGEHSTVVVYRCDVDRPSAD